MLDRSIPPLAGKPKDVKFPDFKEVKTDNGITILVIEDNRLPLVSSSIVFKRGKYFDSYYGEDCAGLGSIMSELITLGTPRFNGEELSERIDYLGADVNVSANFDAFIVNFVSLSKNFSELFDLVQEMILQPVFDEKEFLREKSKRLNEIIAYNDDCEYLSTLLFNKVIYDRTPYSLPLTGTNSSLRELSVTKVKQLHSDLINPGEMLISFIGDITADESIEKVEKYFSHLNRSDLKSESEKIKLLPKAGVYLTNKGGAVQASMKIGHRGIEKKSEDFLKIKFMNTILGGSFTSRINHNLREVNGFTYGARSFFIQRRYAGDFCIETEVKNDLTAPACEQVIKVLREFTSEKITEDELELTKNYIAGSFPLQLETPQSISTLLINLRLFDMEKDFYDNYVTETLKITSEEVLETARKYINPDEISYCLAGDVESISGLMEQIGEVKIIQV
ncbi:MAG: M16B family peptidase [Chlorobi bacterium OLB4]|jgi:Predicted Zn-dependent peptidases|nr:MAG: M16B family peptidase [Chlorobi bacterium OLB4]MBW7856094.1 insulinase family protein [Ignavibacteria bacterium]OQY78092.1 MAG: hypothetical protein B6D43_06145 [Ignavibacteriales bacterium UTCHB1]